MSNGPLYAFGGAHPHALPRNQDAMTGLATGKKIDRPQDILTPQVVVDFVETLWGGPIVLDPCASRDARSVVKAPLQIFEGRSPLEGGLMASWVDRTYVNTPYKHLKEWLAKAVSEARGTQGYRGTRIVMLAPTRGHRDWWHAARDTCGCVIELKPLVFVGYPGSFPAPLSLLLWNDAGDVNKAIETSGLRVTKVAYL